MKLEERLNRQIHRGLRELRLLRKDAEEMAEVGEDVADEPAPPSEENEPTANAGDVQESAASEVIVRNEATAGVADGAEPPVVTPPARSELGPTSLDPT
jgi:hypothetical protein